MLYSAQPQKSKAAKKAALRLKWRDYRFVATLVIWPLVHFAVFWVYVNFQTILRVFQSYRPLQREYVWVGLENLKHVFREMVLGENEVIHGAMMHSLFSAIPGLFVILPLAFITAYAFYKHVPGERLFRVLFYFPSMISIVVLTMSYKYMFDPKFGTIRMLLEKFGYTSGTYLTPVEGDSGGMMWFLIYLYCVWSGLGSNVILMGGAMQRIPKEITESARLDGVGFWRESVQIVLPLIMPTVTNFIVLTLMGIFGFMTQPMLLSGDSRALTVATYIYYEASNPASNNAITTGILFSLLCGPFVFLIKIIIDKFTPKVEF